MSAPRRVYFLGCRQAAKAHELAAQRDVTRRLAALLRANYCGDLDESTRMPADAYLVPNDTLTSLERAGRLGIRGADDLFGGVVPYPFVATKVITHGRVAPDAAVPEHWSDAFALRVRDAVLPGFSAFTLEDAQRAGRTLLAGGPVRVKAAAGSGGAGQAVVRHAAELDARLVQLGGAIDRDGVVLERDLERVRTYSIGMLHVGPDLRACYVGTQENTRNHHGHAVYGGSSLTLLRGGFDALERHVRGDADLHRAVALARCYHEAAIDCFAGMFASRSNYDVVLGQDRHGGSHAGVLEQSWRIGGASGAEVAALQVLYDQPQRTSVRASTVERYGPSADAAPEGAIVSFAGTDPEAGPIIKYTLLHDDGDDARTQD